MSQHDDHAMAMHDDHAATSCRGATTRWCSCSCAGSRRPASVRGRGGRAGKTVATRGWVVVHDGVLPAGVVLRGVRRPRYADSSH
eukprot:scaffold1124_cov361-Prasinococcus_capsulatus_cf.AAC.11